MASDKDIEGWLNDHTGSVQTPSPAVKAPADAEIEGWLNDKTGTSSLPSGNNTIAMLQQLATKAAPQVGQIADAALSPMATLLRAAPDMGQRAANFVQGKPNQPAQDILQAAGNRPDITGQVAASMIPGVGIGPSVARVAGMAGTAALNPDNRTANAVTSGGLQALMEALPYGAGKMSSGVKAIMSKASGVDAKAIQQLFENPSLLWTGPTMQEAKDLYAATAQKIGLSPEVSDNVLFNSGKRFVRGVLDSLNTGETVSPQTLLDARQATWDLAQKAQNKGASNMFKGFMQRYGQINEAISQQAPELRQADQVYGAAANRDKFMHLLPMNQNGTPSVAKTVIGGVAGVAPAVAMSPIVQGVATSAAGAVAKAAPVARSGLQVLRQYLMNQRTNGPGS